MIIIIRIVLLSDLVSISLFYAHFGVSQWMETPKCENESFYSAKGFYVCLWCILDLCKVKVCISWDVESTELLWQLFMLMPSPWFSHNVHHGCNKYNRCSALSAEEDKNSSVSLMKKKSTLIINFASCMLPWQLIVLFPFWNLYFFTL